MKKIISLILIFFIFIGSIIAIAEPYKELNQKTMNLSFSDISIIENEKYSTIKINGANSELIIKDHYVIPIKSDTFIFPFGTKIESIDCIPRNIQKETIEKELQVTPSPILFDINNINKPIITENPITINNWFDYDIGVGLNGKERCIYVKIQTYPVQYNPQESYLEWSESIEININYIEPEQTISYEDEYQFIVITPSEFIEELEDLIEHKNNRGITTKLITLDEIYTGNYFSVEGRDDPEKIKYFIKNSIENWGTYSVLLVGGSNKFPTRETHIRVSSDDDEIFVSDLYYADIYNETYDTCSWDSNNNDIFAEYNWEGNTDELDLYPDVYLGRLACINEEEVITSVNKIINYENNKAYTQDWFTNIILIGGDTFPGDSNEVLEGEYVNTKVIEIMDGFIPNKLWVTNGLLSSISPSGVSLINDAINNGCGFIDISGHGNTAVWATHEHENENIWLPTPLGNYRNSDVERLVNGDKLPIVITGACSVGKYNKDNDCFSWSFISNPNGGGIASCGSTALGYAYGGQGITQGLIEKMAVGMFEAYRDGSITFGEMWVKAINSYNKPRMDETDHKTIEEWQPFGDPTLAIGEESLKPLKPETPEGSTTGKINEEHIFTTVTSDPDGDKIYYLFDWGNEDYSGWLGPYNSGEIVEASYIWTDKGDYEIKVKAKDEHGVQSEWSDPLPISMAKIKISFRNLIPKFYNQFPILFSILQKIKI
jgi:hypothetical protein